LKRVKQQILVRLSAKYFRKEHFFHDVFLMVEVISVYSFGASFGQMLRGSRKPVKRVGGKIKSIAMKKLVICLLVLFLTLGENISAQILGDGKQETKICNELLLGSYDTAIDSLHSFFSNVRNTLSPENWDGFMNGLAVGNLESAFGLCGNSRNQFIQQFINVHNNFVNTINDLRITVYSTLGNIPDEEKFAITRQKIECHVGNLPDPIVMYGELLASGPCEVAYTGCKRSARRTRNSGWWNCTFGGLGLGLITGPGGLIAGVSCHTINQADYFEALSDCSDSYDSCLGN
jgi:hypothetical protein